MSKMKKKSKRRFRATSQGLGSFMDSAQKTKEAKNYESDWIDKDDDLSLKNKIAKNKEDEEFDKAVDALGDMIDKASNLTSTQEFYYKELREIKDTRRNNNLDDVRETVELGDVKPTLQVLSDRQGQVLANIERIESLSSKEKGNKDLLQAYQQERQTLKEETRKWVELNTYLGSLGKESKSIVKPEVVEKSNMSKIEEIVDLSNDVRLNYENDINKAITKKELTEISDKIDKDMDSQVLVRNHGFLLDAKIKYRKKQIFQQNKKKPTKAEIKKEIRKTKESLDEMSSVLRQRLSQRKKDEESQQKLADVVLENGILTLEDKSIIRQRKFRDQQQIRDLEIDLLSIEVENRGWSDVRRKHQMLSNPIGDKQTGLAKELNRLNKSVSTDNALLEEDVNVIKKRYSKSEVLPIPEIKKEVTIKKVAEERVDNIKKHLDTLESNKEVHNPDTIPELKSDEKYIILDKKDRDWYKTTTKAKNPVEAYDFIMSDKLSVLKMNRDPNIKIYSAKNLDHARQQYAEEDTVFVRFKPNSEFWKGKREKGSNFSKFKKEYSFGRLPLKWNKSESAYTGKVKENKVTSLQLDYGNIGKIVISDKPTTDFGAIEERKAKLQTQVETLDDWSEKNESKVDDLVKGTAFDPNRKFGDDIRGIPMGQPILTGHHSQRKHEKALEKQDMDLSKAVELREKATSQKAKAERLRTEIDNLNKVSSKDVSKKVQNKVITDVDTKEVVLESNKWKLKRSKLLTGKLDKSKSQMKNELTEMEIRIKLNKELELKLNEIENKSQDLRDKKESEIDDKLEKWVKSQEAKGEFIGAYEKESKKEDLEKKLPDYRYGSVKVQQLKELMKEYSDKEVEQGLKDENDRNSFNRETIADYRNRDILWRNLDDVAQENFGRYDGRSNETKISDKKFALERVSNNDNQKIAKNIVDLDYQTRQSKKKEIKNDLKMIRHEKKTLDLMSKSNSAEEIEKLVDDHSNYVSELRNENSGFVVENLRLKKELQNKYNDYNLGHDYNGNDDAYVSWLHNIDVSVDKYKNNLLSEYPNYYYQQQQSTRIDNLKRDRFEVIKNDLYEKSVYDSVNVPITELYEFSDKSNIKYLRLEPKNKDDPIKYLKVSRNGIITKLSENKYKQKLEEVKDWLNDVKEDDQNDLKSYNYNQPITNKQFKDLNRSEEAHLFTASFDNVTKAEDERIKSFSYMDGSGAVALLENKEQVENIEKGIGKSTVIDSNSIIKESKTEGLDAIEINNSLYDKSIIKQIAQLQGIKRSKTKQGVVEAYQKLANQGKYVSLGDQAEKPLLINWNKDTYFLLAPLDSEDNSEEEDDIFNE